MAGDVGRHLQPGRARASADQLLINPDFPAYNFDVIDGVTYQIDVSQPARYDADGKLVEPGRQPHRGPDVRRQADRPGSALRRRDQQLPRRRRRQFPRHRRPKVILAAPDTNRDVIVRYIVAWKTINPAADGNWSFAPLGGRTAIFETGPRAEKFLGEVTAKGLRLAPAGKSAEGFARYRITL